MIKKEGKKNNKVCFIKNRSKALIYIGFEGLKAFRIILGYTKAIDKRKERRKDDAGT